MLSDSIERLYKQFSELRATRNNYGLTSIVQPLDVCLNKPFKDRIRKKWCDWMVEGVKEYTKGGATKAASLETVSEWVSESWNDVPANMVQYSFKKCAISNAMDGTEDDLIWDEPAEEEDEPEMNDEEDMYDDRLTENQWNELFGHSDEEDFDGF